MAVEHNTLTGSQLHEPKGVAGASSGTYYMSDGAASGAWTNVVDHSNTASPSGAANVEITGLGDLTDIWIELDELAFSVGDLELVLGDSSSYLTTGGYDGWYRESNTEINVAGADFVNLRGSASDFTSPYVNGLIHVSLFNRNLPSVVEFNLVYAEAAGLSGASRACFGLYLTDESRDYDRIKITPSTGTLTGSVRVFGLKGTAV